MWIWSVVFLPGIIFKLLSLRLCHKVYPSAFRHHPRIPSLSRSLLLTSPPESIRQTGYRATKSSISHETKKGLRESLPSYKTPCPPKSTHTILYDCGLCSSPVISHPYTCCMQMSSILHISVKKELCTFYFTGS